MNGVSIGLKARVSLEKHGFRFTHSLGQNFLLDDALIGRLLDAAEVIDGENILEIGPGAGVMTRLMADRGARVLAVELDQTLEPVLAEVLGEGTGVKVVFADALKADIASLVGEHFGGQPFRVVANLPYYITSDAILKLLRLNPAPTSVCVLVQKEAAERILAPVGAKIWGALSAQVQYRAQGSVLMDLPPAFFTPPPHVDSALLGLEVFAEKPIQAKSDDMMDRLIAVAFAMRRKTLANNLTASLKIPRERALELIRSVGLDDRVRGEVLTLAQFAALSDALLDFSK